MIKRCNGCGCVLQNEDIANDGYVENLDKDICLRCFRLTNYGEYRVTKRGNVEYQRILEDIHKNDLVVYVSSLLDLKLEDVNSFSRVLLVLTKRDILPKSVKDEKIIRYVKDRYPNLLDVVVVSSQKNYKMDDLYNKIRELSCGNLVYVVGKTNSGKSTLINKLMQNYSLSNKGMRITTSMYPSTTLDKIEIEMDGLKIIDTPGLVDAGSIISFIDYKALKAITPKGEIKPLTYQLKGHGSLMFGDLIRMDYDTLGSSMTVYVANGILVKMIRESREDFHNFSCQEFELARDKDIVIPDFGFLKFVSEIKVKFYTFDGVEIWERDNLI